MIHAAGPFVLASGLIGLGIAGVLLRRNAILVLVAIELILAGEEDHLVLQQGAADLRHGSGIEIATESNTADPGTDRLGHLVHGDRGVVVAGQVESGVLGGWAVLGDGHEWSFRDKWEVERAVHAAEAVTECVSALEGLACGWMCRAGGHKSAARMA